MKMEILCAKTYGTQQKHFSEKFIAINANKKKKRP